MVNHRFWGYIYIQISGFRTDPICIYIYTIYTDMLYIFLRFYLSNASKETMTFLTDFVLEADIYNDIFASTPSFEEIYSYLHDRCRAVRIDLHLQQPWSSRTQEFVTCHEYCLRFEILANILFREKDVNKSIYDPHLGLQAISQTIDPLLAAYQDARERGQAFDTEAPIRRLVTGRGVYPRILPQREKGQCFVEGLV